MGKYIEKNECPEKEYAMNEKTEEYEKCCAFCEKGTRLETGDVLCREKGIVDRRAHCLRFSLDILKIEPKKQRNLPTVEPVDLDD